MKKTKRKENRKAQISTASKKCRVHFYSFNFKVNSSHQRTHQPLSWVRVFRYHSVSHPHASNGNKRKKRSHPHTNDHRVRDTTFGLCTDRFRCQHVAASDAGRSMPPRCAGRIMSRPKTSNRAHAATHSANAGRSAVGAQPARRADQGHRRRHVPRGRARQVARLGKRAPRDRAP
jgi:hypothetical protein